MKASSIGSYISNSKLILTSSYRLSVSIYIKNYIILLGNIITK